MVTSSFYEHVGDELCSDWCSRLVFFVLSGVEKVGDDGGDSSRRGNLDQPIKYVNPLYKRES